MYGPGASSWASPGHGLFGTLHLFFLFGIICFDKNRTHEHVQSEMHVRGDCCFTTGDRGDGPWGKKGKTKIFFLSFWYQSKARAGWPTRLRLIRATPWADFAVITAQLWSIMTAIFSLMKNFAFNCYLRPRSWDCCQIFKTTDLFLLHAGLFPFSLSEMLWDTCISMYLHQHSNLEVSSNERVRTRPDYLVNHVLTSRQVPHPKQIAQKSRNSCIVNSGFVRAHEQLTRS